MLAALGTNTGALMACAESVPVEGPDGLERLRWSADGGGEVTHVAGEEGS